VSVHFTLDSSLIKKRIVFNFSKVSLQLDLSESLFSSFAVDLGTKALLNSLRKNDAIDYSRILDLGCGYGPMGLFLKAQDPSRVVHMVDRDALAVAFTSHNAELNNLHVTVYPSLDYEQAEGKFSLIVTNFPAKTGTKGMEAFVYGASTHLASDGVLAIVVVRELTAALEHVLDSPAIRILCREYRKGHSIFHVAFTAAIRPFTRKYERHEMILSLSRKYRVRTAVGLPEFDTLSFATRALFSLLKDIAGYSSVLVLEPGQGHGAVGVMDLLKPKGLVLVSRDLLSLRFAERNVRRNFHIKPLLKLVPYLENGLEQELIVWNIQRKSDLALNTYNLKVLLKRTGPMLICGKAALLHTLVRNEAVTVLKETSERNYLAKLLRPKG